MNISLEVSLTGKILWGRLGFCVWFLIAVLTVWRTVVGDGDASMRVVDSCDEGKCLSCALSSDSMYSSDSELSSVRFRSAVLCCAVSGGTLRYMWCVDSMYFCIVPLRACWVVSYAMRVVSLWASVIILSRKKRRCDTGDRSTIMVV